MNVRRGWLAVLGAMLIAAPTFAKDPVATDCPAMAMEELISCSNCCPWLQGSLAKSAGSQAGKWLVAVVKPSAGKDVEAPAAKPSQTRDQAIAKKPLPATSILPSRPSPKSCPHEQTKLITKKDLRPWPLRVQ